MTWVLREKLQIGMFGQTYKRYVLAVLTGVYTLNVLDRGLMTLLFQPIKEDLALSDTQLGFLTGIAFGLFYATLGLPIARLSDRGNRVTIASVAIGLWGATVMSCLFVANFAQLVLARVAAAIGESGCMPPTYSLIGDYFPGAAERARAMAIYSLAGPIAALVSFGAGGWLGDVYGWRLAFFAMGIPGLLMAVLVKLTISDPRVNRANPVAARTEFPGMSEVLRTLWIQPASRHLCVAFIILYTLGLGLGPWYAAFMMRSHGMGATELGVWFGLIFCFSQIVGILFGGYVAGRRLAHNERRQMQVCAIMIATVCPLSAIFLLVPEKHQALAALVPLIGVWSVFLGPTFSLLQRLVGDEMRATTMAVVMLLANLIGSGIGPQAVGIFSDLGRPYLGVDSLRYAMLAVSFLAIWAAYHLWRVGATVKEDLSSAFQRTQSKLTARREASAEAVARGEIQYVAARQD